MHSGPPRAGQPRAPNAAPVTLGAHPEVDALTATLAGVFGASQVTCRIKCRHTVAGHQVTLTGTRSGWHATIAQAPGRRLSAAGHAACLALAHQYLTGPSPEGPRTGQGTLPIPG